MNAPRQAHSHGRIRPYTAGDVDGVGLCPSADSEKVQYELGYVVAREHRRHAAPDR